MHLSVYYHRSAQLLVTYIPTYRSLLLEMVVNVSPDSRTTNSIPSFFIDLPVGNTLVHIIMTL